MKLKIYLITVITTLFYFQSLAQSVVLNRNGKELSVGSNFYLSGGTVDAATEKTNAIYRFGNLGIGTATPATKLEINHGTAGFSGLRFTNLNSSSAANTSSTKVLGLNSSGDVILTNVPGTQNIVAFSTATPTTSGVVFTPNTPADESVLYQSDIDNSMWTYNGTAYVTYVAPSSTAWFTSGTTNDAGNSKTSNIYRTGNVGIGVSTPSFPLDVQSTTVNPFVVTARFLTPSNTTAGNSNVLNFGVTSTTGNSADWRYVYQGSASTSNRVDFGMSGYAAPMMSYLNSGNVGIGTTAPAAKLHIQGITATTTINADAQLLRFSRPGTASLKWDNIAQFNLGNYSTAVNANTRLDLALNDGATLTPSTVMTWQANGNVGIGTSSPSGGLTIFGPPTSGLTATISGKTGITKEILFGRGGATKGSAAIAAVDEGNYGGGLAFFTKAANGSDNFPTGAIQAMNIDWLGNVGIGNNSPSVPLVVQGVTGKGVLKLVAPSVAAGDNWWLGFGHGTTSTDANDRARVGVEMAAGGAGRLFFTTGLSNAQTRAMFIDESQRVGIGTSAPTTNLDVVGGLSLRNVIGAAGSNYGIEFNTNSNSPRIDWVANGSYIGQFSSDNNDFFLRNSKDNTGNIRFWTKTATTGVERLTILNNGNVGIGTSAPTAQLEVATNNGLSAMIRRGGASAQTPANLILQKTSGADAATHGAVVNGDYVGRILFSASNGSAYPTNGTDIVGYAAGTQSGTNNGGGIFFRTVPQNSVAQSVERMRIEHNGNIGIGTATPASKLEVNGSATNTAAYNAAAGTTIDFSNSNLAYTSASPTAFTITNIKNGGTYTLAVQGGTQGTASFTATGFTFLSTNNGQTISGKQTLYTFIVMGTTVYYYMEAGF